MVSNVGPHIIDEVRYLWSRIQDINRHVNMDVGLLTTLWIRFYERQYWRSHDSWCSSIFIGENRVVGRNEAWCGHFAREENSLGERVNPISLYGIWLTGNVDYALIQYTEWLKWLIFDIMWDIQQKVVLQYHPIVRIQNLNGHLDVFGIYYHLPRLTPI